MMIENVVIRVIVNESKLDLIQKEAEKTSSFLKIVEQNKRNSADGFVNLLTIELNPREQARFLKILQT